MGTIGDDALEHNYVYAVTLCTAWKSYLELRYIKRSELKLKTARWINIAQGPCWKDPTGKTIVKHPYEVWIRRTLEHTKKPVFVNVARWMSVKRTLAPNTVH